jgi:signal transduction histidine kinase
MQGYIVSILFTSITSIILGTFVFLKGSKSRVNRIFALLSLSIAVWSFGIVMSIAAPEKTMALFWVRFGHIGSIMIPALFLHFIYEILSYTRKRVILKIAYFFSFVLLVINCTNLLIKDVVPKFNIKYYTDGGPAYPILILYVVCALIYSQALLIRGYRQSTGLIRNQLAYLLFASLIGFIGGLSSMLPIFKINIPPFGMYFVSIYAAVIAYAIVKHRLMDISFVIKKGVTYAYASFLLLIPLFLLILYVQKSTFGHISFPFSILCIIFIASYFFPQVKVKAERTIEQYIFKNKFDYKKTISDLSKAMVSILNINELCRKIITTTTEAMQVKTATIFILHEEDACYRLYESIGVNEERVVSSYPKDDPFFTWLERYDEIFVREELERHSSDGEARKAVERLREMDGELCIPLVAKKKLIGIISLGMKGKGEMYTHEDIDLLSTMSNQAIVALENARLYEDLYRAKVQMQRADRLASLGTLTAGLAHEIRNPLVAIKTFTQLLPERFDDSEFREHFLSVTAGEVDRIASLVTELLDFARPSQPKLNREDLNQIVEKMMLLVDTESHKKNVQIIKNFNDFLPPVVLDREQIKQVLLNVLLNAVDATPEDGTIFVETAPIKKNGSLDYVQIVIKDTGRGIPEEDLDKVFTPFFTTKHEGSGLGLAISHQIIQEHHGNIEVESTKNQGTTFRINIPVNPLLKQEDSRRSQ